MRSPHTHARSFIASWPRGPCLALLSPVDTLPYVTPVPSVGAVSTRSLSQYLLDAYEALLACLVAVVTVGMLVIRGRVTAKEHMEHRSLTAFCILLFVYLIVDLTFWSVTVTAPRPTHLPQVQSRAPSQQPTRGLTPPFLLPAPATVCLL